MAKAVSLKILKLQYNGDSIGNNILIEIEVAGEKFSSFQTIKPGSAFEYNQEIRQFRGVGGVIKALVNIRVTEKDFLFSDKGETIETIYIDSNALPQTFEFQIKVQERNKLTFSKSTAVFVITLEANEFNSIYPRPQIYNSNNSKKNYNRFDTEIAEAVGRWNDEFLNQEYPPNIPLDPSLVKAMIYVESVMGYGRWKHYPSYPDVMQVADPENDAIYALKNIYNPNKKKKGTEYEVLNDRLKIFEHKEANGNTPSQSIFWGVRYLYHTAQSNIDHHNGTWGRIWQNWNEAMSLYNGGGDKKYKEKVLEIYKNGNTFPDKIKLWSVMFLLLTLPLFSFGGWLAFNQGRAYISFKDITEPIGGYKVMAKIINGPWFENTLVANVYPYGGSMFGVKKDKPVITRYIDIDNDKQKEITVTGMRFPENVTKYILKKRKDNYEIVQNIDQFNASTEAFSANQISFHDEDNDGQLEVLEDYLLPYTSGDQIWTNYYRFDGDYYRFYKQDRVDASDFKRLFGLCSVYCINDNEKEL